MRRLVAILALALLAGPLALTFHNKVHTSDCNGSGSQSWSSPGTTSFTVPGCGMVSVTMTANGAGGGGGGAWDDWEDNCNIGPTTTPGGTGGAGGRGVSTRTYAAGTVISITVGSGGAGGQAGSDSWPTCGDQGSNGSSGGLSKTEVSGSPVAQGDGGGGGTTGAVPSNGSTGGGTGDTVTNGGGAAGGAAGQTTTQDGSAGTNGSVTISWSY